MYYIWYFSVTCKILGIGYFKSIYMTAYLKLTGKDHPEVARRREEFARSFRNHPASRKIFSSPNDQVHVGDS